ncbi:MAG: NAD(P)H-dependent glycerol-3-phosphate dehydrogenase [Clostridiales bacterium]|nr:NAD(P)H-dependent glycerol-3-phosphate dehydrogenase [Clostridiales bacterium]
MTKKVAVIGAGSWGTALAVLLSNKGIRVGLWVYEDEVFDQITIHRENSRYLPGIKIPEDIEVFKDQGRAIKGADIIVLAVSSQAVRIVARDIKGFIPEEQIVVNVAKGLELVSLKRLSQVIEEEIPQAKVAVLSGPSHAEEVALGIPTTIVSAAREQDTSEIVQDIFMCPEFRVYTNHDVIGVEMGGALKNIIALAAGVSDGLGHGDNTKAALMTRGIAEITRLGKAMGAEAETFAGLTGVGDLIVTCTSVHSRNRKAGIMLGSGKSLDETLAAVGMAVEGVYTCEAAYGLARKMGVEMPITEQLYKILFEGKEPEEAVRGLMLRDRTYETEMGPDKWL